MDDFMDSLVKEVEGNLKPIRAERLDDSTPFPVMDSVPVTVIRENEPAPLSQSIAMYREQPRYYQTPPMYREPSGVPMDQEVMGIPRFRGDVMGAAGYREPVMGAPQFREPAVSMPVYQEPSEPVRSQDTPATAEGSGTQGTPGAAGTEPPKDGSNEDGKDLFLHVHRENVKCYRNTQATIIENSNGIKMGIEEKHANIHSWLLGLLVLSIINFGATALLILHMIFGFV